MRVHRESFHAQSPILKDFELKKNGPNCKTANQISKFYAIGTYE